MKTKPRFETVEYLLPAYWASYLINCDASGISEGERQEADSFCAGHGVQGCAVDCGDSFFHWRNDARVLGGDVCQVTFLVATGKEVA